MLKPRTASTAAITTTCIRTTRGSSSVVDGDGLAGQKGAPFRAGRKSGPDGGREPVFPRQAFKAAFQDCSAWFRPSRDSRNRLNELFQLRGRPFGTVLDEWEAALISLDVEASPEMRAYFDRVTNIAYAPTPSYRARILMPLLKELWPSGEGPRFQVLTALAIMDFMIDSPVLDLIDGEAERVQRLKKEGKDPQADPNLPSVQAHIVDVLRRALQSAVFKWSEDLADHARPLLGQ